MKKTAAVLALAIATLLAPVAAFAEPVIAPEQQSQLMGLFITHVAPVLFSGLALLLGWVFLKLGQKFGVDRDTKKSAAVLERLMLFAQSVVSELEATLKPELAARTADGVLTKAERLELRDIALARLKSLAGEKGLEEVRALLGIAAPEFEAFLMGLIERAVDLLPKAPSVTNVTVRGDSGSALFNALKTHVEGVAVPK